MNSYYNTKPFYICLVGILILLLFIASPAKAESPLKKLPFNVGERLDFKVYFEFILGGHASMSVASIDSIDGHPTFHIVSRAKSTKTVDMFYKVRDRIESWRDVEGGFSRLYIKQLREGKHKVDKRVVYAPVDSAAYLYRGSSEVPETLSVAGHVQDVLSAFYEMRTRELEVGKSVWIDIHDINKRYDLEVKVLRKEQVEVPAGKFNCLVLEPLLKSSGLFRKEGKLQIWISDDEHRIPVVMKSELYFGAVYARLIGYRLGDK